MTFPLQPTLENDIAILYPLQANEFETLYAVANDPKIWEQHPNKDRWKRDVFQSFFEGAIQSKGAFKIVDKATGEVAGSTRFYDFSEADKSIFIGYTFYGTKFWGTGINPSVKKLMLDYAFQYVDKVQFHIGATNIRSQIAIERLGAIKTGEQEVAYFGEPTKLNFVYTINKSE
ncbi:MAG: GNAT family N-acetyltransferase [Filimonas sp.]|nr:GNAT family N-acetyltransferase [Filimonas sp.]